MRRPADRPLVRAANKGFPLLWRRGLAPAPDTRPEILLAAARRRTRLDDFGDPSFREGLDVLCRALADEAALTPLGRVIAHGGLVRALAQRLTALEWLRRRPEILQRPLPRPIIVLGAMRSGTTRMQRLLASDRRLTATRMFEATSPAPPLGMRPGDPDSRILHARGLIWALNRLNPQIGIVHPTAPMAADEELGMLELSISGAQIEAQRPVPSFARWAEAAPQTHAYRFLGQLLQLNGWIGGRDPARPWVLKSPQYQQDLAALIEVFPDARIVAVHRDPHDAVPSAASLAWNYMAVQSAGVTRAWCGREWLRKTALRLRTAAAVRAANPHVPAIDVTYEDMDADWLGTMRRVYAFLDMPLDAEAEAAMRAYRAAAARGRHYGRHRYRLEDYGLTPAHIAAAFAPAPPHHPGEGAPHKVLLCGDPEGRDPDDGRCDLRSGSRPSPG